MSMLRPGYQYPKVSIKNTERSKRQPRGLKVNIQPADQKCLTQWKKYLSLERTKKKKKKKKTTAEISVIA